MEIFNAVIDCNNLPEAQDILKELDSERDLLLTSIDYVEKKIEIQYIQPINQIKTIGVVPSEVSDEIFDKYDDNASIDVSDYMITYENGVFGIIADIAVEEGSKDDEEEKDKKLPLPLFIIVGTLTGILTVVLVVIRLIKSFKKK